MRELRVWSSSLEIEGFNGESKDKGEEDAKGNDHNSRDTQEVMFVSHHILK